VYEAAFRQAGILWASTTEEMLELAAAFSSLPLRGKPGGHPHPGRGWGVITADACNELGLEVPPLDESIVGRLDSLLPAFWSRGNPVDMVATMGMDPYIECLEALISWERVDAVISLSGDAGPLAHLLPDIKKKAEGILPSEKTEKIMQHVSESRMRIYERVCELVEKYRKPVFAVGANFPGAKGPGKSEFALAQFRTPERAAKAPG